MSLRELEKPKSATKPKHPSLPKEDPQKKETDLKKISDSLCMQYINLLGSNNMTPKYFTETLKLQSLEKKQCSRLFKSFKEFFLNNEESILKKVRKIYFKSNKKNVQNKAKLEFLFQLLFILIDFLQFS